MPSTTPNTPGDSDSIFKITQPGSYYLAGNIQGLAAKHGIEIAASGVTLDLNGFDLRGVTGSLDGVSVGLLNAVNVSVRNGSVRSWGGSGINLTDAATSDTDVSDIVASQNVFAGIRMGFGGTITRCTAYNNTGAGIAGALVPLSSSVRLTPTAGTASPPAPGAPSAAAPCGATTCWTASTSSAAVLS